ncbi:hypothetical protein PFICI_05451 [Pestalotiopsis fici W106-1]|uniref:Sphingoid long-chain base transporter RSB1 n=1 Tax=Pestalotiopsis fici (strain W106-1 / CGMCC3.15140) TaxID=1229662 RepID=W3XBZ7_PESFW|nr:uncharacterized protein PFICI_05451 [Pestalotiopsis fici W106-1]ETS83575.1 hypothetical protein PFICI_05451 [Pestalotiopsis fici W106-1]
MSTNGTQHFSTKNCKEPGPYCPVEATVLGYYPNLGANAFLVAGFATCLLVLLITGIRKKTWGYSAALVAGCILEVAGMYNLKYDTHLRAKHQDIMTFGSICSTTSSTEKTNADPGKFFHIVGYIGRIQMHANPFSKDAFQLQISAIVLAPTLLCISIYLTLKHAVLSLSPGLSRVRPRLYPLIFVPADVSCLILQAIGGGLAASAGSSGENADLLLAGDRVIIVGIALQVAVLLGFGTMATDYLVRVRRVLVRSAAAAASGNDDNDNVLAPGARALWVDKKARMFFFAVLGAYFGILIRCIYRIAEMSGGWGSTIMRDQPSFIVLEGFMVLIPVALLTAFPPGFLFPAMAEREAQRFRKKGKKSDEKSAAEGNTVETGVKPGDETSDGAEVAPVKAEKPLQV